MITKIQKENDNTKIQRKRMIATVIQGTEKENDNFGFYNKGDS